MVTFAKPPLNEVVLGQVFAGRPDFLIPHFGLFWERIRGRYPRCAHTQTLVSAEGPVTDVGGNVLPRVWFLSDDESQLIQLQQDRVYANWRQTETVHEYPRFPAIRSAFEQALGDLNAVVSDVGLAPLLPVRLELAYINVIPSGEGWSTVEDLGNVLRDFRWDTRARFLPHPERYQSRAEFPITRGTKAMITASTATRTSDSKEVLRLEIQVGGLPADGQTQSEWVTAAHDFIVSSFKDLTQERMHGTEFWGLK